VPEPSSYAMMIAGCFRRHGRAPSHQAAI